jgi:hypothetical protein
MTLFDKPKAGATDYLVRPPDFLLDAIIEKKRKKEEQRLIEKILAAIDKLNLEIAFKEAYLFGSVTKPYRFSNRRYPLAK